MSPLLLGESRRSPDLTEAMRPVCGTCAVKSTKNALEDRFVNCYGLPRYLFTVFK